MRSSSATGATILPTAVRAPRMNAICERLACGLRREVLDRTLILGEAHQRAVLTEYQQHYIVRPPGHRPAHPDTENPLPASADPETWQILRKPVLSGLINEYERAA